VHYSLLSGRFDGFSQFLGLVGVDDQLKDRDKRKCEGQLDQIPIIFRFLVSVRFILCGFFGSLSGWNHFDNNRRFLRAALICGRSLVGLLGFVLCLL